MPPGDGEKKKPGKTWKKEKSPIDRKMVKALSHPLRVKIFGILNEKTASPKELADEVDESLGVVSYHVKVLAEFECIELVDTAPRRGAVEHYYKAIKRPYLSDQDWLALPDSIRPGMSADLVESIMRDAAASIETGAFDERKDRHVTRATMRLDETGWKEMIEALAEMTKKSEAIQKQSSTRLKKAGEKGIRAAVVLMGFELPDGKSGKTSK